MKVANGMFNFIMWIGQVREKRNISAGSLLRKKLRHKKVKDSYERK